MGQNVSGGLETTCFLQRSDREEAAERRGKNLGPRVSGEDDGHRANAKELEMGLMRDSEKGDDVNFNLVCPQNK